MYFVYPLYFVLMNINLNIKSETLVQAHIIKNPIQINYIDMRQTELLNC